MNKVGHLGPDWRVELEELLDSESLADARLQEIGLLIARLPDTPRYYDARLAVKSYIHKVYGSKPHAQWIDSLQVVWALLTPDKDRRRYRSARRYHLAWSPEHDVLLESFFNHSDYRDTPGAPAHALYRALMWIKDGRWITWQEFAFYNQELVERDEAHETAVVDTLWTILTRILEALKQEASSKEYLTASKRCRMALAALTNSWTAQHMQTLESAYAPATPIA